MNTSKFNIGLWSIACLAVWTCYVPSLCHAQESGITEVVSRIWTQADGAQVSGKFAAQAGNEIKIEKYDGTILSLTYDSLIAEDKSYVDEVVKKFGSAPGARTWSDINLKNFRGTFVRPVKSELEFLLLNEERRIRIEALFLSAQDLEYILEQMNGSLPSTKRSRLYRIWTYRDANQNELRSVGRFIRLAEDEVMLQQMGGAQLIPLTRLSDKDLDYVRNVDTFSGSIVDRYLKASSEDRDSKNIARTESSEVPTLGIIWWISLGLIFLLMLGLISIKYVYESGQPEYDDEI